MLFIVSERPQGRQLRDTILLTPLFASKGKEQIFIELRGSTTDPKRHESICQKRGKTPDLFAACAVWMGRVCGVATRQPRIDAYGPAGDGRSAFVAPSVYSAPHYSKPGYAGPAVFFNFGFS